MKGWPVVCYCFISFMLCLPVAVQAQVDSSRRVSLDSFLRRQKGLVGRLARNIMTDTIGENVNNTPVRTDILLKRYEGRFIRRIEVERLDFGTPITDTSKRLRNKLTNLANTFHHKSREYVIRNNLFFKKGDKLSSFLIADNERHLRDQSYLLDAKIIVKPAPGASDSVDVFIRTKDVLSIGGSIEIHNPKNIELSVKEDNLGGWANRLALSTLYDMDRRKRTAFGVEYINRNIGGSFIDGYAGITDFANTFNTGRSEETKLYAQLIRPLVNPYMKWTYSISADWHNTQNMFISDSVYDSDTRYRYFNYDVWVGRNTGAYKIGNVSNRDDRLRTLISMRYFKQHFIEVPGRYANQYYYQYADLTGVLAAISIFQQNFYKTQYIYGFGRNEDVPEGIDISLTTGWTDKQQVKRPYVGLDFQRYYFSSNEAYYIFTFRTGAYWRNKTAEDMNLLFNLDHFSRLLPLGKKWKSRSFVSVGITGQINPVLNEPLLLQSSNFGLQEWRNDGTLGGNVRTTLKAETVFYTPFALANFRFAPFIFANLSTIKPHDIQFLKSNLYSSIGGGVRTRNESLIFGTFEFKAFYFPRKNFYGDSWRIETNTNIKFKYNRQYIKRPELIQVN
jgi:hypothetical protein